MRRGWLREHLPTAPPSTPRNTSEAKANGNASASGNGERERAQTRKQAERDRGSTVVPAVRPAHRSPTRPRRPPRHLRLPPHRPARRTGPRPRRPMPLPRLHDRRPLLRPRPRPSLAHRTHHRHQPAHPLPTPPPHQATTRLARPPRTRRHRHLDRPHRPNPHHRAAQRPALTGPPSRPGQPTADPPSRSLAENPRHGARWRPTSGSSSSTIRTSSTATTRGTTPRIGAAPRPPTCAPLSRLAGHAPCSLTCRRSDLRRPGSPPHVFGFPVQVHTPARVVRPLQGCRGAATSTVTHLSRRRPPP